MTATLILALVFLAIFLGHLYLTYLRDRALIEMAENQSRDSVAGVERVLAAFVEQTKDSNQHISLFNAQPGERPIPNYDYTADLPSPIQTMYDDAGLSDPTDFGWLAEDTGRMNGAAMDPRDPMPFGVPGLTPEYRS